MIEGSRPGQIPNGLDPYPDCRIDTTRAMTSGIAQIGAGERKRENVTGPDAGRSGAIQHFHTGLLLRRSLGKGMRGSRGWNRNFRRLARVGPKEVEAGLGPGCWTSWSPVEVTRCS